MAMALVAVLFCVSAGYARPAPYPMGPFSPGDEPPAKQTKADKDKQTDAEQPEEEEEEDEDEQEDRYFAVVGGVVHTIAGPTLEGVTILCKNGKIEAIGRTVDVPEDAERLDATDFQVYPGLVAVRTGGLLGGSSPQDSTDVYGLRLELGLAAGITTVLTGNTAAKLTYGSIEDMVVKDDVFTSISYTTRKPKDRRKMREALDKLVDHLRKLEAYEQAKKKNPDAEKPDDKWIKGQSAKYLKLLKHESVAVASAETAHELHELAELCGYYGIRMVVRGVREGWTVAPELGRAGMSTIITPRTRVDMDLRRNMPNGSSIENARILHDAGVPVAIVPASSSISTWGVAGRDLLHLPMEAAFAVRGGLPEDVAVRAITLDAARILGIAHRVGSIEVGKDADFVITDGELLSYMTMARWTIVNGRIAYDKQKDSLFDHIRPDGDLDAPPPDDHWPKRLGEDVDVTTEE